MFVIPIGAILNALFAHPLTTTFFLSSTKMNLKICKSGIFYQKKSYSLDVFDVVVKMSV